MRIPRIYQNYPLQKGKELSLTEEAGQHLALVLRKKIGDKIHLFNGDNWVYEALICEIKKKKISVKIQAAYEENKESPCSIHLGQGVSKGERMELVIQKAVELGVKSITPLLTEHSVVRLDKERQEKKQSQWQAIAIAACEQCGRNEVPRINKMMSLAEFVAQNLGDLNFVLSLQAKHHWRDYSSCTNLSLVIGPEGGLSAAELDFLRQKNFNFLSLGPRVLRTETAALTALSILQAVFGDL